MANCLRLSSRAADTTNNKAVIFRVTAFLYTGCMVRRKVRKNFSTPVGTFAFFRFYHPGGKEFAGDDSFKGVVGDGAAFVLVCQLRLSLFGHNASLVETARSVKVVGFFGNLGFVSK